MPADGIGLGGPGSGVGLGAPGSGVGLGGPGDPASVRQGAIVPDSPQQSPAPDDDVARRLGFGAVAELYDRARPGYPQALINDVMAYAGIAPGQRVLDVGAGTGMATAQFAALGLEVTALEPSAEMLEVARHRLDQEGLSATIEIGDFESARLPGQAYALVYAATAWHWIDPAVRWQRVLHALSPDGTLAVFWNWPLWRRGSLREQLDVVYRDSGADLDQLGPMYPLEPSSVALCREWVRDVNATAVLGDAQARLYPRLLTYSTADYLALLGTYADHIGLEASVQERLFAGVRRVVDGAGGQLQLPWKTLLLLARRSVA